jgi:hypothetical protein
LSLSFKGDAKTTKAVVIARAERGKMLKSIEVILEWIWRETVARLKYQGLISPSQPGLRS